MTSLANRLREWTVSRRELFGHFAFELIIVFVGVTAAFALENTRANIEENRYRNQMVGALRSSLDDWAVHGQEVDARIDGMLRTYDLAVRQTDYPPLPIYRESGAEGPPTRAWDGIVATGAARALDPELFFHLARFYSRADSWGARYRRYNQFSEASVLPYANDPAIFYAQREKLKPEFAAYIDRLRDLRTELRAQISEAAQLRDKLPR